MAGRKPKYQEFLTTLQDVTDTTVNELADLIGKKQPNISDYLSGDKQVGKSAIKSGIRHLAEWSLMEDKVMLPIANRANVCTHPGIYFIYDSAGNCVYIGQARNLRTEVNLRLDSKNLRHGIWRDPLLRRTRFRIREVAAFVTTYRVDSARLRHNLEALFLRTVINQTQNSKLGKFR
jgi:hypothetical protein